MRCDAIYVLGPASNSEVRAEVSAARKKGLPIFDRTSLAELRDFLNAPK